MAKRIYCGNLSFSTTDDALKTAFEAFGEVVSAKVIVDRVTERSKGFGFVEMSDDDSADKAIQAMDGKELEGRRIRVNVAEERERKPRFSRDR